MKRGIQALAFMAALAGCAGNTGCQIPQPTGYDVNDNALTRETLDSLVDVAYLVYATEGPRQAKGSCVAYKQDGKNTYLLTVAHLLGNPMIPDILTIEYDGKQIPAQVKAVDFDNDIAVLTVKGKLPYFRGGFADISKVKAGDLVRGVGFPYAFEHNMTEGVITSITDRAYLTSAHANPGDSGGPYFVFQDGKAKLLGCAMFYVNPTATISGISRTDKVLEVIREAEHLRLY